ncbi:MAG: zf-HC2 domain-containing protein [Treponema sp.]|jgi:hypothetical protein|nr:zf-HC2 domain-containing protein [Treponema sp.]
MCPDREILSVYLDGELPSPWREKLESHLEGCARCRERLEGYRVVRRVVLDRPADPGLMEAAKERIRAGLEKRGPCPRRLSAGIWRRRITVPIPAAAAAAAVFIVILALAWIRRPALRDPDMAVAAEIDMRGIIPVSDMNGVLQYLGGEDAGNYVILRLPESRSFTSAGEPLIIKEADYTSSRRDLPVREPWRELPR